MKISEYEKKSTLLDNDIFLIDSPDGTKTILAKEMASALLSLLTPSDIKDVTSLSTKDEVLIGTSDGIKGVSVTNGNLFKILNTMLMHQPNNMYIRKNIYRGQRMGTSKIDYQDQIKLSLDLYLGDYWEIDGNKWRIVDFNYYLGKGETSWNSYEHMVIMPDKPVYSSAWHSNPDVNSSGYYYSKIYDDTESYFYDNIVDVIFNYDYGYAFNQLISDNSEFGMFWDVDQDVTIPNEIQIFGSYIKTPNIGENRDTSDTSQLSLMKHCPEFINPSRTSYWLRDYNPQEGSGNPVFVDPSGCSYTATPIYAKGVRPLFCVY